MSRKLATIQIISKLDPIKNADFIEKCTVLGWECVVRKGEFKEGDMVVYIEIDSILPDIHEFEFMRDRKFRVRTIKLRKQISQGLVIPLSILPTKNFTSYKVDDDVTDIIGIKKYLTPTEIKEREIQSNKFTKFMLRYKWYRRFFKLKRTRETFPKFIKKTDEERIQNISWVVDKYANSAFYASEKLDGTSLTAFLSNNKRGYLNNYKFGVCSRNFKLNKKDNVYWEISNKKDLNSILKDLIEDNKYIILQGEIVGPGIQKNRYKLSDKELFIFNLIKFTKDNPYYLLDPISSRIILSKYEIKHVPIITLDFKLKPTINECLELAKGKSILYNTNREGLVLRNYESNLSLKIINNDYLLENE